MNPEEILEAAKEAGALTFKSNFSKPSFDFGIEELTRFAAIIEKRTIERCAVKVEQEACGGSNFNVCADYMAAAIRKLGEQ